MWQTGVLAARAWTPLEPEPSGEPSGEPGASCLSRRGPCTCSPHRTRPPPSPVRGTGARQRQTRAHWSSRRAGCGRPRHSLGPEAIPRASSRPGPAPAAQEAVLGRGLWLPLPEGQVPRSHSEGRCGNPQRADQPSRGFCDRARPACWGQGAVPGPPPSHVGEGRPWGHRTTWVMQTRGEEVGQHTWKPKASICPWPAVTGLQAEGDAVGWTPRSARCWGADVTRRWGSRRGLGSLGPRNRRGPLGPSSVSLTPKDKTGKGERREETPTVIREAAGLTCEDLGARLCPHASGGSPETENRLSALSNNECFPGK